MSDKESGGESSNEEQSSIDCLNDYCLLHIMEFVDLAQLWRLRDVSQRWRELVNTARRELDFTALGCDGMKMETVKEILKCFGPRLRSLKINFAYFGKMLDIQVQKELLPLMAFYCQGLENLDVNYVSQVIHTRSSLAVFRNLHEIRFGTFTFPFMDIAACFRVAKNLRRVSMPQNLFRGHFFFNMKNLERLELGCSKISTDHMNRILQNNSTLKSLAIYESEHLDDRMPEAITTHLKYLEELTISNNHPKMTNFEILGDIKSLKKLILLYHPDTGILDQLRLPTIALFRRLIKNNQLEHLRLHCVTDDIFIHNESILDLIPQLSNLKLFSIIPWKLTPSPDLTASLYHKSLTPHQVDTFDQVFDCFPNELLELVKACPNLRDSKVTRSTEYDISVVVKLVEHFNTVQRTSRFDFYATETGIPRNATEDEYMMLRNRLLNVPGKKIYRIIVPILQIKF